MTQEPKYECWQCDEDEEPSVTHEQLLAHDGLCPQCGERLLLDHAYGEDGSLRTPEECILTLGTGS